MSDWLIYAIGFLAQTLFSGRLLMQWLVSEKHKKVLTPSLFWKLSLLASFLLFVYGWLRDDFAIMLGQTLTYFIYIRNLQLQGEWQKAPLALRWFLWLFPAMIVLYAYNNNVYDLNEFFKNDQISLHLVLWGSLAQIIFTLRFVYQWIHSEKNKESNLPKGFWVMSLVGSLMILTYAIFRRDPVLFIGHIFGIVVYIRNLMILRKQV
jgi:lipid-A-disaccharide synthase-like uncharacterized protein